MPFDRNAWKKRIPPDELHGRLNSAGCAWNVELCAGELNSLRSSDEGAFRVLYALMETAMETGLPTSENGHGYRVPVGEQVARRDFGKRDMPWLGELRVDERTPKRPSKPGNAQEHRLYFGEPGRPDNLVLGTGIGVKRGQESHVSDKQTRQMKHAMWAVIHWCEQADPPTGWRVWNWHC